MDHKGIEYRGEWTKRERFFVERTVNAVDEFLNALMPNKWVFGKGEGYSVSQPSLCELSADTLGGLLEKIRREAVNAKPFTY